MRLAVLLSVLSSLVLLARTSPSPPSPVVQLECGPAQGSVWTTKGSILAFQGIPYAAAPTGTRRFQPPSTLEDANACWNGTFQATKSGKVCAQKSGNGVTGSEDCLFINIWTPALPNATNPSPRRPVFAYIHGGSLISGCSDCIPNAPFILAQEGAVSVSFSYRLNVLGFLALQSLSQHDSRGVSGNYGLLDQIAALQWIQRNIAAFGGDPNNVLVWGQSSGGTAILALVASPLAKGLFQAAVSMSASPNISVPVKTAESLHAQIYMPLSPCANISSPSAEYACLMNASYKSLIKAYPEWYWNPAWLFGLAQPNDTIAPLPIVDNYVLFSPVSEALANGQANDVILVLGNLAAEPDLAPADIVYHLSAAQFAFFLKDRWSSFGNSSLVPAVLDLYDAKDYNSSQEQYDEISADYGTICGNIDLAVIAAQHFKSPVYSYIGTYVPVQHICDPENSYCTRYPYHMMDMAMALVDGWFMNGTDYQFGAVVRNSLLSLAFNHTLPSPFTPIPTSGAIPTTYLDLPPITVNDARADKCAFWKQNGFYTWQWQN